MKPYTEIRFKGTDEEVNAAWLEERKKGIGGSDAAAILGMSKYASPYTVWLEKTGRVTPDDISDREPVYWGKVLEDVVAKEYAKRHPDHKVRRLNALLRSTARPWQQASLDRVVVDERGRKGVLEVKTANARLEADWKDGVPDYYYPQPTHYLAVTGFEFFTVAVLVGGQHYKEFTYERDEEDIAILNEKEGFFWSECVLGGSMPAPTGLKCDSDALLESHPDPSEEYVEMLDEEMPEIAELLKLGEEEKRIKERKSACANAIKARIGDAKGIRTPSARVTWPRAMSERFDSKAFLADNPEAYEKYCTRKPKDMGLRVSETKE